MLKGNSVRVCVLIRCIPHHGQRDDTRCQITHTHTGSNIILTGFANLHDHRRITPEVDTWLAVLLISHSRTISHGQGGDASGEDVVKIEG